MWQIPIPCHSKFQKGQYSSHPCFFVSSGPILAALKGLHRGQTFTKHPSPANVSQISIRASNTALWISSGNLRLAPLVISANVSSLNLILLSVSWLFGCCCFAEVIVLSTVCLHWSQGIISKCCVPCSRWILPVCKYFCINFLSGSSSLPLFPSQKLFGNKGVASGIRRGNFQVEYSVF